MRLMGNVWLEDEQIMINGKTMTLKEAKEFRGLLDKVCVSSKNLRYLRDKAKAETGRFPSPLDVVKWILKK